MITLNYPIVILDYEEMEIVLEAAETSGVIANLITPPGAAWYAGPLYWQSMIEDARESHPDAVFRLIADCGDDAGLAMKALSTGLQYLLFSGDEETVRQLSDIAKPYEATLVTITGEGLDLANVNGEKSLAAVKWLEEYSEPG